MLSLFHGIRYSKYGNVSTPLDVVARTLAVDEVPEDLDQVPEDLDKVPSEAYSTPPHWELQELFASLQSKFGFQQDSVSNQLENLCSLLDSRRSRIVSSSIDSAEQELIAIRSLHREILSGPQANYFIWYQRLGDLFLTEDRSQSSTMETPMTCKQFWDDYIRRSRYP